MAMEEQHNDMSYQIVDIGAEIRKKSNILVPLEEKNVYKRIHIIVIVDSLWHRSVSNKAENKQTIIMIFSSLPPCKTSHALGFEIDPTAFGVI